MAESLSEMNRIVLKPVLSSAMCLVMDMPTTRVKDSLLELAWMISETET